MSIVDLVAAIYLYLHDVKTACSGYITSYFICTSSPIFCHHYQKPGPIIKKRISRFGGCVFIQSSLTVKWLTSRIYYCCVNTAHVWLWGRKWQKVCVSYCSPIPVVCCFKSPFCFLLSKLQSCCLSAQECQQFPPLFNIRPKDNQDTKENGNLWILFMERCCLFKAKNVAWVLGLLSIFWFKWPHFRRSQSRNDAFSAGLMLTNLSFVFFAKL